MTTDFSSIQASSTKDLILLLKKFINGAFVNQRNLFIVFKIVIWLKSSVGSLNGRGVCVNFGEVIAHNFQTFFYLVANEKF